MVHFRAPEMTHLEGLLELWNRLLSGFSGVKPDIDIEVPRNGPQNGPFQGPSDP